MIIFGIFLAANLSFVFCFVIDGSSELVIFKVVLRAYITCIVLMGRGEFCKIHWFGGRHTWSACDHFGINRLHFNPAARRYNEELFFSCHMLEQLSTSDARARGIYVKRLVLKKWWGGRTGKRCFGLTSRDSYIFNVFFSSSPKTRRWLFTEMLKTKLNLQASKLG